MAYITGKLTIERVIRQNAVEELLRLDPENGGKAIVFDLEKHKLREGLCSFIKECENAKFVVKLEANGGILIPADMETRFSFYREFYGLSRWVVIGVELLQTNEKKEEKNSSTSGGSDENKEMKKLEAEPPPEIKKPKLKISKKLEPMPLNIVPASIVWIAGTSVKSPAGPAKQKTAPPAVSLSGKLGGHKVGLSAYSLGHSASGLKSLGGMSR